MSTESLTYLNMQQLEKAAFDILMAVGEDPRKEGLIETPKRVARAWEELTEGYRADPEILFKTFETSYSDALVIVKEIKFHSLCMHHLLPFHGTVDIGYIPQERVLGLSKFARLVEVYSRRLQIQEQLTGQIADSIHSHLLPKGTMVVIEAEHMCMSMRGAEIAGSVTVTSAVRGVFLDKPQARQEFLELRRSR